MKKIYTILSLASLAFMFALSSCATVGIARLPDTDKLFISTASEDSFVAKKDLVVPYQPLGFVEYYTPELRIFGANLVDQYKSLENAIAKQLVKSAVDKLGADAVVDFKFEVSSSFRDIYPYLSQLTGTPVIGIIGYIGMGIAAFFNVNSVKITGMAVKKKA
ncbi:MAG: hypothetical protein JNM63_00955 [Spirochaetia bacterium]|nr:hypothetical protein [Spirochaetia bacterium]